MLGASSSSKSGDDPELESKCRKLAEKFADDVHVLINEPSLALYRLQEHCRRTFPALVEKKYEASKLHADLSGRLFDLEESSKALDQMVNSSGTLQRIYDM